MTIIVEASYECGCMRWLKFTLGYLLLAAPLLLVLILRQTSIEVRIVMMSSVGALILPFAIVPIARQMTNLTFAGMKFLNRRNLSLYCTDPDAMKIWNEGKGFLVHLRERNSAVAIVRATYFVCCTILFYKGLDAWLSLVQSEFLEGDEIARMDIGQLLRVLGWLAMDLAGVFLFGFINIGLALCFFNYVTREKNDYLEIQAYQNVAVSLVYFTLVLCICFVSAEVAQRLLATLAAYQR